MPSTHDRGGCLYIRMANPWGLRPGTGWRCSICGATWTLTLVQGPAPLHETPYGTHGADQCGMPGTPFYWCGAGTWRRPLVWTLDPTRVPDYGTAPGPVDG